PPPPRRAPRDERLRDARPGGGVRGGRPRRHHEPRPHRAAGHAGRDLREARDPVRHGLPRQRERVPRPRAGRPRTPGAALRARARLGQLAVAYPDYMQAESRAAMAFVRSHELDILRKKNGRPAMEGKVVHINPARPIVKVRVYSETFGVVLNVDLSWDRFAEL